MALFIWPPNQTVITGVATEATLLAVKGDTAALVAKDYATQTTLAAAKLVLDSIDNGLPNALGRQAAAASTGVVLSTEDKTSLDAIGTSAAALVLKDFATEATLGNIQIDGSQTAANSTSILADTTLIRNYTQKIAPGILSNTGLFDTIIPNLAGASTDIYTYKTGGIGGTTTATLTINYSDATKAIISSIVRT
jgi:hypothetical protein